MRHLLYWARSGGLGLLLALFFLAPAWGKDTTISDGDPNGAKTPYRIGDIVTDDTIDMYGNVHGSNRYSTNAEARYNTLTFDWRDGKPPILVGGYNDWFSQGCGGQGPGDVPVCHNPADGYVMTDTFSANDLLVSLIGWDSMTTNEAYSNFTNIYNLGPGGSIAGSVFGGLAYSGTANIEGMIFEFSDEWTGRVINNTINIKPPADGAVEILGGVFGGIVLERAGLEGDEKIGDILAKVVSKAAVKILAGPLFELPAEILAKSLEATIGHFVSIPIDVGQGLNSVIYQNVVNIDNSAGGRLALYGPISGGVVIDSSGAQLFGDNVNLYDNTLNLTSADVSNSVIGSGAFRLDGNSTLELNVLSGESLTVPAYNNGQATITTLANAQSGLANGWNGIIGGSGKLVIGNTGNANTVTLGGVNTYAGAATTTTLANAQSGLANGWNGIIGGSGKLVSGF